MRRQFVIFALIALAATAAIAHFAWPPFWWALVVILEKDAAPERYQSDFAQATSTSFGASCPMPIQG